MKKYLSLFVILSVTFVWGINTSKANDGLPYNYSPLSPKNSDISGVTVEEQAKLDKFTAEIKTKRDEAQQNLDALKTNIKKDKNKVQANIKEIRLTAREKALENFDTSITRISDLENKVNAQIIKLETKGVVTTDAKTFLATAETETTEAKSKIAEIDTLLTTSINELTAENKAKLKILSQDTQTLIQKAHQAINSTIESLKDATKVKQDAEKAISKQ